MATATKNRCQDQKLGCHLGGFRPGNEGATNRAGTGRKETRRAPHQGPIKSGEGRCLVNPQNAVGRPDEVAFHPEDCVEGFALAPDGADHLGQITIRHQVVLQGELRAPP